ncbi:MAG: chemotaxis protein CheX [Isosphaeraceae bacterium]
MDILERPDARPVSPEDRAQIIEPFISAAQMTLSELARTDLAVRSVYRVNDPRTLADLSAVIGVTADDSGVLVLSFPNDTATALARRVLADAVPALDDDLVRDCLGELANIVAGQAKTLLADTPYQLVLSTPSVLSGAGLGIGSKPGTDGLIVVFRSDAGDFALQVCLDINQA